MKNILQVNSSLFPEQSISKVLLDEIVASLSGGLDQTNIRRRDLGKEPIPHLDADWLNAINKPENERTALQKEQAEYSQSLIDEVRWADIIVLGSPMYNFGVSSSLKAWFDHLARAGVTFRYTSNGPEGLLKKKRAIVVTTRGGLHKDKPSDTQIPFVQNFFQFIGIEDVQVVYAEGLNINEQQRAKGLAEARASIAQIAAA